MSEVCVKIFDDRDEAELFRSFLEDHGIESYIMESDFSSSEDEGVKLIVEESDKFEALKIIRESCEDDYE